MSASKSRIYHKLQLAAHRVQKAADRALLAAAGITTAQSAVLHVVAIETRAGGSVTQREVARQLGINESAMTAMVTRLTSMGLLDREHDAADTRAWNLQLTARGRAARKGIEQPFGRVNHAIDNALTVEEIERLADQLVRIAAAFEEK
jgi:MarR family transcriptional regulator, organic hydroperoxide resistance regulator